MKTEFLLKGDDVLSKRPSFKLVGRDTELKQLIKVLSQRYAHNIVLVGPSGVGCTALCYGLQQLKSEPNAPVDIMHKRIFFLDVDGMFSDRDNIEQAFEDMMKVLTDTPDKDAILVIEDTRDFIEAIENSGNKNFINRLMRHLDEGSFQAIWEARDTDLDLIMRSHSHMRENFTIVDIKPPKEEDLNDIIESACIKLSEHHKIPLNKEAQEQAIYLTTTYPSKEHSLSRAQPEASLVLLDRACTSYLTLSHENPPLVQVASEELDSDPTEENKTNLLNVKQLWENNKTAIQQACAEQSQNEADLAEIQIELAKYDEKKTEEQRAAGIKSQEEQQYMIMAERLKKAIPVLSDKINELIKVANEGLELGSDDVLREFASLSGIEFDKLNENESAKLLALESSIKKKLMGQDHVVELLSNAILTARTAGLKQRGKPDAAFLFCGPSGVGKTEIAKQLALNLKDSEKDMIRFDMSNFASKHTVATLIGAPRGYQGYEEGGLLTNAVRKNPNAIILLDEIEKADSSIFDIFLAVLDDAQLQDNQGRTVSFEHTILIFTTNIGSKHLLNTELEYKDQMSNVIEDLEGEYRPEFLNRFSGRENIVGFNALPLEVIEMIAGGQLKDINEDLEAAGQDIKVTMSPDALSTMCEAKYDSSRGARAVDGIFRTNVYSKLARMIQEKSVGSSTFDIIFKDGVLDLVEA